MSSQSRTVIVPSMEVSLDQFLTVIRQLDEPARAEVARVLMETEMDSHLRDLVAQLAESVPADDIGDADIQAEINAVRREGN
jgi:hypothetical protein